MRRLDRAREAVVAAVDLRVAVDQGWLVQNVVDATRLPRAVEQPDQDRVVTPEEWAQIRLQRCGEGTVLMCDLALDCGLRYEEVVALRPMDVVKGDERSASHVWIGQYDRVDAASGPSAAAESPLSPTALEQLSAVVVANASLSAAEKAALLLELSRQTTDSNADQPPPVAQLARSAPAR